MTPGHHPSPTPLHRGGDRRMSAARPGSAGRPASLTITYVDGSIVMEIGGELDLLTVPDLHDRMQRVLTATTGPVVVVLTDVGFLSSIGLRLLLTLHTDLAAHQRRLRLVTGEVRTVTRPLQITGLDRHLDLYPDLATALAACA